MELRSPSRLKDSEKSVGNKKLKNSAKQKGTANRDSTAEWGIVSRVRDSKQSVGNRNERIPQSREEHVTEIPQQSEGQ